MSKDIVQQIFERIKKLIDSKKETEIWKLEIGGFRTMGDLVKLGFQISGEMGDYISSEQKGKVHEMIESYNVKNLKIEWKDKIEKT